MLQLVLVSVLAGILSCDTIAAGQFMLSRPIIVGPVIGLCLGNPYVGFIIGICVELIWARVIPVGGIRVPNSLMTTALATAAAVFSISNFRTDINSAIILAMVISIPCGILFKVVELKIRLANSSVIDKIKADVMKGKFNSINFYTFLSIIRICLVSTLFFTVCYILITQIPRAYWLLLGSLNIEPKVILRFIYILCFAQLFEMFIRWK